MIIMTFTKLFDIRIVANRRSESANRDLIRISPLCSSSSISLSSAGESEKKAISEAETKPEAYKLKSKLLKLRHRELQRLYR